LLSSTFVALVKVLHHRDQLPFGPHSDFVRAERVDDFESQRGGQFEVLHGEADGGGAFADHADVRRHGEELGESRARVLVIFKAQRQRIDFQLRKSESRRLCARRRKRSHANNRRRRQAVEVDREPAELIPSELRQGTVSRHEQRSTRTYMHTFKALEVGQLGRNALESVVVHLTWQSQSSKTTGAHNEHTDK
jgi:hypothetical protein